MYKQLYSSVSPAVNPFLSMHLILWYILVSWIEHYTTKILFKIQLKSIYQSTELLTPPRTYTPIQTCVIECIIRYLIFSGKCRLEDYLVKYFQAGWRVAVRLENQHSKSWFYTRTQMPATAPMRKVQLF